MKRRKPYMKRGKAKVPKPGVAIPFDQSKEVRAIARERLGPVKPSQAIVPKKARKKPKHRKPLGEDADGAE